MNYCFGTPREQRIEEMEDFKACIEVDLADENTRRPYRNLYQQYIDGKIDREDFGRMLKFINEHRQAQKITASEETELTLTPEQMRELFADRKNYVSKH